MSTHICPSCGREWQENYCPECARTIDRGLLPTAVGGDAENEALRASRAAPLGRIMTLVKSAIVACLIGAGISGIGVGLMALGGWGPCGPGSWLAATGGCLYMAHIDWLLALFPGLEPIAARPIPGAFVMVWPALVWSVLAFLGLMFWKWVKKDEHQLP